MGQQNGRSDTYDPWQRPGWDRATDGPNACIARRAAYHDRQALDKKAIECGECDETFPGTEWVLIAELHFCEVLDMAISLDAPIAVMIQAANAIVCGRCRWFVCYKDCHCQTIPLILLVQLMCPT